MHYILYIIKYILNNYEFEFVKNEKIDEGSIYSFAKEHHIAGLMGFCEQVINSFSEEIKKLFLYEKKRSIAREATQEIVISTFLEEMEANKLFCMPLKGYQIKNMYAHPAMRYMTDTDILIDGKDSAAITEIMKKLGFKYDHDTMHEIIFSNNQMVIELHKTLVPSKLGKSYDYYANYLRFAKDVEGKQYVKKMSDEDLYIYSVDHIARHYIEGGIGIKHIADVYVLSKRKLNTEYIEDELAKLGLNEFEKNLRALSYLWFSDEKADSNAAVLEMADFVLKSGAYGTGKNRMAADAFLQEERLGKKQSNLKRVVKRIFVAPEHIKMLYPIVKKHGFLYPIFIFVRIFSIVFKRTDTKDKLTNMVKTTSTQKDVLRRHFEKVGLFKEL